MDSLIKQTRARFSGSRDETLQSQRTLSTREKKRSPSWIKRQFSRQMSWDSDFIASEYPTAVAAAAYAIQSLEESKYREQKDATYGASDKNLNKTKSRVDDANTRAPPQPLKSALKYSDEALRASFKDQDSTSTSKKKAEKEPSMKKRISFADTDETSGKKPEGPTVEKTPERVPSIKRPPSTVDKQLNITDPSKAPEATNHLPTRIPTQPSETIKPPPKPKLGPSDAKADAWEKEELASIRERYEKLKTTIDNWESKKKKKAKRKIENTEAELDKKRTKALRHYHNEITRIESITGGARTQAEENRRNEEFKVKEKANKIRLTGKLPPTCLCF